MTIEHVTRYHEEVLTALQRLLPQLKAGTTITEAWLRTLLEDGCIRLYVVRDEAGHIAGSCTLALQRLPTGLKAWLEDVVVDARQRGRGLGRALVRHAIAEARRLGAEKLDLTSSPERTAANALYQKEGFLRRQTNIYRMILK